MRSWPCMIGLMGYPTTWDVCVTQNPYCPKTQNASNDAILVHPWYSQRRSRHMTSGVTAGWILHFFLFYSYRNQKTRIPPMRAKWLKLKCLNYFFSGSFVPQNWQHSEPAFSILKHRRGTEFLNVPGTTLATPSSSAHSLPIAKTPAAAAPADILDAQLLPSEKARYGPPNILR